MSVAAPSPVARAGSLNLALRAVKAVVDGLIVFATARGFGADGRGLYALTLLAATFMVIPILGMTTPLSAELAHRRATLPQLQAASVVISFVGGGLIAAGAVAVAAARWPHWQWLVVAGAPLPVLCLAQCQIMLFQAAGEVVRMALVGLAQSSVTLVTVSAAAIAAPGRIYVALAAWACVQPLVPLAVLLLERRRHGLRVDGLRPIIGRLVRRGIPVSLGNTILRLNYRVDVFVVAALMPLSSVGVYSVAVAIGEMLWEVSRALIAGVYRAMVASGLVESLRVTMRAFRHSFLMLVGGGLAASVAASVLLGPVFGSDFSRAWVPLALLVPGIAGLGAAEVLRIFFLVRLERSREYLIASTGSMLTNLALALALVPFIGISGAAISTSVAYVCACLYLGVQFARAGGPRQLRLYFPGVAEIRDYLRLIGYYASQLRRA